MRKEPAIRLLDLARVIAGQRQGMSLDDIASEFHVSRRTAERMRDALAEMFPQLEEFADGKQKRWRLPNGLSATFREPSADELAVLRRAIRRFKADGDEDGAALLQNLGRKIEASLKPSRQNALAPDVELLMESESLASRPGPRPFVPAQTFQIIRNAMLMGKRISFHYRAAGADAPMKRVVVPFGVLFGRRAYLVAAFPDSREPVNYRLDRMDDLQIEDTAGTRPAGFDLDTYAARSFGVFQEETHEIVLQFAAEVANDVENFRFHPTQSINQEPDGSLIVRFRAGGLREIAWHLFTWGDAVKIVEPETLRATMADMLLKAGRALQL